MVDPELLTIGTKVKLIDDFPNRWKSWRGVIATIASPPGMQRGKTTYKVEESEITEFYIEDMDCIVEPCEPISIDISSML